VPIPTATTPGSPVTTTGAETAHGVVVVDKPAGWTSHDVVARMRRVLGTRKVGHSGTLDPDATGVLVLGAGRATRLLRFLTGLPKSYVGEIVLGAETSTLDASGEVTARHDMSAVGDDAVRAAAAALTGQIMQIPPMVSAVKVAGRRLHELAREGKTVERRPRPVTVHRFGLEPLHGEPGVWRAEVDCSSGTYVRSLAADLGAALGGGAHLRSLRRTAVGGFDLADACSMDEPLLLPAAAAVSHLDSVTVDDADARRASHGQTLHLGTAMHPGETRSDQAGRPGEALHSGDAEASGGSPFAVFDADGVLLAVYEQRPSGARPLVVAPPSSTRRPT